MKTQLKTYLDELNKAKEVVFGEPPYAAASKDLRSQCNAILAACAPVENSAVVMVVEEIVDAVSGLVDIGAELKLLSRELKSAARRRRTSKHLEFAARLNRLNTESNDGLRFLLGLLSNLVVEDA